METSQISQLPDFEVKRFHLDDDTGSYDMYEVGCPRCRAVFWVRTNWAVLRWVEGRPDDPLALPVGRSCPHCLKTAAIPAAVRVIPRPPKAPSPNNPKPRRIVRRRRSRS